MPSRHVANFIRGNCIKNNGQKYILLININIFQQMLQKTVDQKLKECKTVTIQNVQKSMQGTMIYRYFKDEKIDNDIKKFTHNSKDGYITIEFHDHEKAKQYYDRANFKDKILFRPFNVYFNVQLNENEMKKYYFEGINEENLRQMFDIARKVGICKIYTSYTSNTSSAKLKPNGVLSFIRKDPISEAEFNALKQDLSTIGVKIYPYSPDKGLKCAVILTDFYKGDLNEAQESLEKKAKQQASELMDKVLKDTSIITSITPIVKRREVPNPEGVQGTKTVTKVRALVQFNDYDVAIDNFEQIRKAFINIPDAKATMNFYTAETNSYISLFTSGLTKPQGKQNLTDKQFQDLLVETFRKVNKDVVQVNVFPSGSTYVARVYLKNEKSGRELIVDYDHNRQILAPFYKSSNNIKFNINVDDKTMKKIKQFEKRAVQIMTGIKNEGDKSKMFTQKGTHNMPLNPYGMGNPMNHLSNIMMPPQANRPAIGGPMPSIPNYPIGGMTSPMVPPQMGGMPPMGLTGTSPMIGLNPGSLPLRNQPNPFQENRNKIEKVYSQKAYYAENCKEDPQFEKSFKKTQLLGLVNFVLQSDLQVHVNESSIQANKILQNNGVEIIIDFLKKPRELYSKVIKA